jgi:hypothetical protein
LYILVAVIKNKSYLYITCNRLPRARPPPKTAKLSPLNHLNVHGIQQC